MGFNGEYRRVVTECFLVRHGQIGANVEGLWHGTTDSDLTEEGERQIERLGRKFSAKYSDIAAVYSSPLKRTMNTARAIASSLNHGVQPIPDLIEFGVGEYEGLSYAEMAEKHQFFAKMAADTHFKAPGGESVQDVLFRVERAFFNLVDAHRGERIVMVGHGAAFAILMASLLEGQVTAFYPHQMENTGISHLRVTSSNQITRSIFSDVEHLTD